MNTRACIRAYTHPPVRAKRGARRARPGRLPAAGHCDPLRLLLSEQLTAGQVLLVRSVSGRRSEEEDAGSGSQQGYQRIPEQPEQKEAAPLHSASGARLCSVVWVGAISCNPPPLRCRQRQEIASSHTVQQVPLLNLHACATTCPYTYMRRVHSAPSAAC